MASILRTVFRCLLRVQRQYRDKILILRRPLHHQWGFARWKQKAEISLSPHNLFPNLDCEATQLNSPEMRDLLRSQFRSELRSTQSTKQALEAMRVVSQQLKLDQCSSQQTTSGVQIDVTSAYHSCTKESTGQDTAFVFSYRIEIQYHGKSTVQLKSRNWLMQEEGKDWIDIMPRGSPGVVGLFPVFGADSTNSNLIFQYTSSCVSKTPTARMKGTFQMLDLKTRKLFDAEIAPFQLISS